MLYYDTKKLLLFFLKKKKLINQWDGSNKIPKFTINKCVVFRKGFFSRVFYIYPEMVGNFFGTYISTRKPYSRPSKLVKRR